MGLKLFPKNGFPQISVTVSTWRKNQIRRIGFHKTENSSTLCGIKNLFKGPFPLAKN